MKLKEVIAITPIMLEVILECDSGAVNIKAPSKLSDFEKYLDFEVEGVDVVNNKLVLYI